MSAIWPYALNRVIGHFKAEHAVLLRLLRLSRRENRFPDRFDPDPGRPTAPSIRVFTGDDLTLASARI